MKFDAVVVGGSYAGVAAALQIARARRSVLVLDGGQPRNRFSASAHGVLALDGVSGAEILARARGQLRTYPSVTLRTANRAHDSRLGRKFHRPYRWGRVSRSAANRPRGGRDRHASPDPGTFGTLGKYGSALSLLPRLRNWRGFDRRARDGTLVDRTSASPGRLGRRHALSERDASTLGGRMRESRASTRENRRRGRDFAPKAKGPPSPAFALSTVRLSP